nr:IS3 family transposase [Rhodovulum sp. P5]
MVRCAAPDGLLQAGEVGPADRSPFRRADQGDDRGEPVVRVSDSGLASRFQQEHGAAGLSDQGLAGSETSCRRPTKDRGPSLVATAPNERWSTDMARVWAGKDGWATLALVMDCHTRELLGWHLSRSGKATTAASALEHALIARFGTLGRVEVPFLLRSDNGLVFTSRKYTALVRSYGLRQEFITPHCPQQNGMMERLIRSLKEQCVHRQRFESLAHASRAIGDWIQFYNHRRPHQALAMRTPSEAFRIAA